MFELEPAATEEEEAVSHGARDASVASVRMAMAGCVRIALYAFHTEQTESLLAQAFLLLFATRYAADRCFWRPTGVRHRNLLILLVLIRSCSRRGR